LLAFDPLMLGVAGASDQQVGALLFVFETLAPLSQNHHGSSVVELCEAS